MRVSALLSVGKENAITGENLAKLLGCTARDVSQQVERERRAGIPVCASCDATTPGYFLPQDVGELALYVASLNRRLKNTRETLMAMEEALYQMTGQESLFDWWDFNE